MLLFVFQENTRLSAQDSENTLLDAFLGSSFYNNTWNGGNQSEKASSAMEQQQTITTTIQPKSSTNQGNELSDDGLVNQKNIPQPLQNNNEKEIKSNK